MESFIGKLGKNLNQIADDVNNVSLSVGGNLETLNQLEDKIKSLTKSINDLNGVASSNNMTSELKEYISLLTTLSSTYQSEVEKIKNMKPDIMIIDSDANKAQIEELSQHLKRTFTELGLDIAKCLNLQSVISSQMNEAVNSPALKQILSSLSDQLLKAFSDLPLNSIGDELKKVTSGFGDLSTSITKVKENLETPVQNSIMKTTEDGFRSIQDMSQAVTGSVKTVATSLGDITSEIDNMNKSASGNDMIKNFISTGEHLANVSVFVKTFSSNMDEAKNSMAGWEQNLQNIYNSFNKIKDVDFTDKIQDISTLTNKLNDFQNALNVSQAAARNSEFAHSYTDLSNNVNTMVNSGQAAYTSHFNSFRNGIDSGSLSTSDILESLKVEHGIIESMKQALDANVQALKANGNFEGANSLYLNQSQNISAIDRGNYYRNLASKGIYNDKTFDNAIDNSNSLNAHLIDMSMAASNYGLSRGVNNVGHSTFNALKALDNVDRQYSAGLLSNSDNSLSNGTLDRSGSKQQLTELSRLIETYKKDGKQIEKDLKEALDNGEDKVASALNEKLIKLTQAMGSAGLKAGALIKLSDKKQFDDLDKNSKLVINNIIAMLKEVGDLTNGSANLSKLVDPGSESLNNLKETTKQIDSLAGNLEKAKEKSNNLWQSIKKIASPMAGIGTALAVMGLGAVPTSISGLKNYVGKGFEYYNQGGTMDMQSAQAEYYMGIDPNNFDKAGAINRRKDEAERLYQLSHGQINFDEYNKRYTDLARNVGGHYGGNSESARDDMNTINKDTFAISKAYGLNDGTVMNHMQTFYKELRMSASDASYALSSLAQTAVSSNIPVEKYVQTVGTLASSLKSIGIDGNISISMMNNLTKKGLDLDQSSGITKGVGNALNKMSDDWGMSSMMGIMSGQSSDPFNAIWQGYDRWNNDGSINKDWAPMMTRRYGEKLNLYGTLTAGNEGLQKSYMVKNFQDDGFDKQSAVILTKLLASGDNKAFSDKLMELAEKQDSGSSDEKLKNEISKAENAISKTTDLLTPIQKTLAELALNQKKLGDIIEKELTPTLNNLRTMVEKSTSQLNTGLGGVGNLLNKVLGGETAGGLANMGLGGLAIGLGGIAAAKYGAGAASKYFRNKNLAKTTESEIAGHGVSSLFKGKGKIIGGILAGAAALGIASSVEGATPEEKSAMGLYGLFLSGDAKVTIKGGSDGIYGGSASDVISGAGNHQEVAAGMVGSGGLFAGIGASMLSNKGISSLVKSGKLKIGALGAGAISDIAFNGAMGMYDLYDHQRNGDYVQGDGQRVASNMAIDSAWTIGGAAIGSLLMGPGAGTIIGGMAGTAAQGLINSATMDDDGRGFDDKSKDALAEFLGGKSADELERDRNEANFRMMGFSKEQAKFMADSLKEHSKDLKGLSDDQKKVWAEQYLKQHEDFKNNDTATKDNSEAVRNLTNMIKHMNPGAAKGIVDSQKKDQTDAGQSQFWGDYSTRSSFFKKKLGQLQEQRQQMADADPTQVGLFDKQISDMERAIDYFDNPDDRREMWKKDYESKRSGLISDPSTWRYKSSDDYADAKMSEDSDNAYNISRSLENEFLSDYNSNNSDKSLDNIAQGDPSDVLTGGAPSDSQEDKSNKVKNIFSEETQKAANTTNKELKDTREDTKDQHKEMVRLNGEDQILYKNIDSNLTKSSDRNSEGLDKIYRRLCQMNFGGGGGGNAAINKTPSQFKKMVADASASTHGLVTPNEIAAMASIESSWNPNAKSEAGAVGLMQVMPETARDLLGGDADLTDPQVNLQIGAKYMSFLKQSFKDPRLVAAAYNYGAGNVRSLLTEHNTESYDDIEKYLPSETRNHVKKYLAALGGGSSNDQSGSPSGSSPFSVDMNVNRGENGCTAVVKEALSGNEVVNNLPGLWVPTWMETAKENGTWRDSDYKPQKGDIIVTNGDSHVVVANGDGTFTGNSSKLQHATVGNISDLGEITGYIATGASGGDGNTSLYGQTMKGSAMTPEQNLLKQMSGDPFVDGGMIYNMVSPSLRMANGNLDYGDIISNISKNGVSDESMKRSMFRGKSLSNVSSDLRAAFDKSAAGWSPTFGVSDGYVDKFYNNSISKISNNVDTSLDDPSSSKEVEVTFNLNGQSDSEEKAKFVKFIIDAAQNYTDGKVVSVKNSVDQLKGTVDSIHSNMVSNMDAVYRTGIMK